MLSSPGPPSKKSVPPPPNSASLPAPPRKTTFSLTLWETTAMSFCSPRSMTSDVTPFFRQSTVLPSWPTNSHGGSAPIWATLKRVKRIRVSEVDDRELVHVSGIGRDVGQRRAIGRDADQDPWRARRRARTVRARVPTARPGSAACPPLFLPGRGANDRCRRQFADLDAIRVSPPDELWRRDVHGDPRSPASDSTDNGRHRAGKPKRRPRGAVNTEGGSEPEIRVHTTMTCGGAEVSLI